MKTPVKDFYGKIIGYIEDRDGDKYVTDFYGKMLGRYNHRLDATQDFYGRIVAKGDQSAMLLNYPQ